MNKKNIKYIIALCIVLIIILILGFIFFKGSPDKKNKEEKEEVEKSKFSEDDIINAYNMSKEDAINIVKRIYNGDIYEFTAGINKDSKYIVTVKNTLTEKVTKYLVDPTKTNGSFYEIDE